MLFSKENCILDFLTFKINSYISLKQQTHNFFKSNLKTSNVCGKYSGSAHRQVQLATSSKKIRPTRKSLYSGK